MPSSSSSRLLVAALAATAALGLAACGPDNSSDQGAGSGSATATTAPTSAAPAGTAPTGAASASAAPTGKPGAKPSGKPSAKASDEPEGFCTSDPLPAGQKWVIPGKATTATTLVYKETKDACGINDVIFEPVGADKSAPFAATVKIHLNSVMVPSKDVNAADLAKHVSECIADPAASKGVYPCAGGGDYKVTLDASGKVTDLWERPHS
ncbi:hypothetical protein [Kitasatospora brasiliensis]|uniref:hypothetical protein n=1 Tax=Kitasatospora brasiliensis TaxID=3058040 RepID=UPI00292D9809|nr:hypothetical protein [Kitasatospora sp. K002]